MPILVSIKQVTQPVKGSVRVLAGSEWGLGQM